MKIIKVDKQTDGGKSDELDFQYDPLPDTVKKVIYWYQRGSYDGDGWALIEKSDGYLLVSLSHCSCYSAENNISEAIGNQGMKLSEIIFSDGCAADIRMLLARVKEEE